MPDWLRRLRYVLVALLVGGVFFYILSLSFKVPDRMDPLQRGVVETLGPLLRATRMVGQTLDGWLKHYVYLRQVQRENERLRGEVARLKSELTRYREAFLENQRLRRLLDFREGLDLETVPARIVVHDATGWFQTVMIDKGFKDGIRPDMPVVNEEGVVGHVLEVSDSFSRVLLVTDRESAVDALIQRNRVRGILSGEDGQNCTLRYVRSNQDVRTGDLVITSGKDGIFPGGLRVGVVQQVSREPAALFQKVTVAPVVNLASVEEVLVITSVPQVQGLSGSMDARNGK
ncbi:rod shape-determining protein MreC [Desulfacinum hydrothermale DSM 13146]|uniref:Cell shape-determining protein MreC n=1 Tax=Desulfacinum hydrothermale DSM 13146 TaxID=1121390 RepID=A0A1W1XVV2_9BACT|nr:rod shape-determining protein MreC [Desulfacinum hydrothermale]SMC28007.1 rod shape-determining protein MreC [Desulfacinum hydrothermale DSM 13146]